VDVGGRNGSNYDIDVSCCQVVTQSCGAASMFGWGMKGHSQSPQKCRTATVLFLG